MIEAKVICDSIGKHSPRLTTFLTRYQKFIHSEHCRHRAISLCVSSSRAVPVSKNLEEVRSDELRASPVYWGSEQKGMQSGVELSDEELRLYEFVTVGDELIGKAKTPKEYVKLLWKRAALDAVNTAELLSDAGVHKSIVNRLLEPFLHVNVLVTCVEPGLLNFFGLRLDRAAQPEIRVLAEAMWSAWNESRPEVLRSGQWHLPFIDNETRNEIMLYNRYLGRDNSEEFDEAGIILVSKEVSTARCARLSYTSFETGRRSTIEEDLKLFERLLGSSPIHASPAEHQATPNEWYDDLMTGKMRLGWSHPELHGNLSGWIQHRKTIPNESIAPLPAEYTR